MNATARYTPDKCEVWVPTQNGEGGVRGRCWRPPACRPTRCDVYKIMLGGGFGRRGAFQDYVTQAVLIAKQMPGTPVKLIWSREEDMLHGRYHPIMQCKLTGGLDARQQPRPACTCASRASRSWPRCCRRSSSSRRAATRSRSRAWSDTGEHSFGYTIPNLLIDHAMRNPHVPPGFWRGVNINQNAIFIECFMDELARGGRPGSARVPAQAHGEAPAAARACSTPWPSKIGWGKPAPQGLFRGLAQMKAFNSYVAAACRDLGQGRQQGEGPPHRRARPICGYAVNPAQIERQVAGSFVYGLSALFMQECTVKDGRIEQENFDTYNSMRIAQMPKVEIDHHADRRHVWGGIGEPTICVAAPAVLNAIFARDRQAHPLGAAEEPRDRAGVTEAVAAARRRLQAFIAACLHCAGLHGGECVLGRRRCDPGVADRRQGRLRARARDRRQPPGRPVPAVPQRPVSRGALPGRSRARTCAAPARADPRGRCGCASSMRRASTRTRSCRPTTEIERPDRVAPAFARQDRS